MLTNQVELVWLFRKKSSYPNSVKKKRQIQCTTLEQHFFIRESAFQKVNDNYENLKSNFLKDIRKSEYQLKSISS